MELTPGQTYAGKYLIVRALGLGAMGAVYEAENVLIRRRVAIKVLHAHVAHKVDTLRRFEREAQAAGRIGSSHIVEVLDLGELPDGERFMVMEFLDGSTLQERIRSRGRLTPEEASPIVIQILEGLGAAHQAQIIHRDLKPANVFLATGRGAQDFVKILDFGVSKFNLLNDDMSMTSTGAVLGTPFYMSPEQAKGSRQIDHRSDLYAVGVILYECITGQVPFSAETFNELIFRIVLESPPPVESFVPHLDPVFATIIHKAMARQTEDRYQTASEFQDALSQWFAQVVTGLVLPSAPVSARAPLPSRQEPMLAAGGTVMMNQGPSFPEPDPENARTVAIDPRAATPGVAPGVLPQWMPMPPVVPMPAEGPISPLAGPSGMASTASPDMYVTPKSRVGITAFVLGLLGALIIGGGLVVMMEWNTRQSTASAASTAAPTESEQRSPPPSEPASPLPPGTSAPSAAEPRAAPASSSPPTATAEPTVAAKRGATPRSSPPSGQAAAPRPPSGRNTTPAPPPTGAKVKRTISTEL